MHDEAVVVDELPDHAVLTLVYPAREDGAGPRVELAPLANYVRAPDPGLAAGDVAVERRNGMVHMRARAWQLRALGWAVEALGDLLDGEENAKKTEDEKGRQGSPTEAGPLV